MRLGRGHRDLGKQWWDDPVQRRHFADAGHELPCYEVASDRTAWNLLELALVSAFSLKIRTRGLAQCMQSVEISACNTSAM